MPSILNEALEWLDRAEQAREVAGQLSDPTPGKRCWSLPTASIGSPEPPLTPSCSGEGSWPRKAPKKPDDLPEAFLKPNAWFGQKEWVTTEDFETGTSG